MTAHAKLSASGSDTWMLCPASPRLCAGLPDESSPFAEEGTQAHAQAEAMLLKRESPHPEHAEAVQPYVDLVNELSPPGAFRAIEKRLGYSWWVPEGFGTADSVIIDGELLTIVDLKFGKGVKVDAGNQLKIYALAAFQEYGFDMGIERVRCIISQPRLDHQSEIELPVDELMLFGDEVKAAALATENPEAKAVPGEKQCRWCKARAICRARALHVLTIAGSEFTTTAELEHLLPQLPNIKAWVSDVERYALESMRLGAHVPGYKLVAGRSTRKIKDPQPLLDAGLSEDQIYRREYQTLSAITKALGKDRKAALDAATVKSAGKPAIVPTSDPRQPLPPVADFGES